MCHMHHAAIGYTDIDSESIASTAGLMPQSKKNNNSQHSHPSMLHCCTPGEMVHPPRHWHKGTGPGVSGSQLWWCWQLQSQILDHDSNLIMTTGPATPVASVKKIRLLQYDPAVAYTRQPPKGSASSDETHTATWV